MKNLKPPTFSSFFVLDERDENLDFGSGEVPEILVLKAIQGIWNVDVDDESLAA